MANRKAPPLRPSPFYTDGPDVWIVRKPHRNTRKKLKKLASNRKMPTIVGRHLVKSYVRSQQYEI
ncbi:hypothetical protein AZSP09_18200 [Azospira sp. I09]|nr:hypothetical protein AZSP09_18200 [Azospira sp. I09]